MFFVFFATISTTSSFMPRLRIVSIIPGMESRAPERTDTSRGRSWSPNLLPVDFSTLAIAAATWASNCLRIRAIVIVKITANLSGNGESRRHWQTDPRHLMEVRAFAAQQSFHRASSVRVAIPEVINVTRRARSLPSGGFARSESDRFPRALKSFSKIRFSFCGHNLQRQRPLE